MQDYCSPRVVRTYFGDDDAAEVYFDPLDLSAVCSGLRATGGGDYPEASKTALIRVLENITSKKVRAAMCVVLLPVQCVWLVQHTPKAVVIHYTDAPPHHRAGGANMMQEKRVSFLWIFSMIAFPFRIEQGLMGMSAQAMARSKFGWEWTDICQAFRDNDVPVFTFLPVRTARCVR